MKRSILILAVLGSLLVPGVAGAHKPHARLSIARGEAMIRANAMLDEPSAVVLSNCRRSGPHVECWVTESDAHTLITDNGEAIVAEEWSYEGMAG